jgi:hypothetical protein
VLTTVPKERPSLSAATAGPLAAMPSLAVRAAFARTPSAASAMAERNGVFRRAEALALAVEAAFTAADTADALSFEVGCYSFLIFRTGELHDAKNEVEV